MTGDPTPTHADLPHTRDDAGATADLAGLAEAVRRAALAGGLSVAGIAPADRFTETRRHLAERRAAGLHGGMQFTYRNPSRSTDPGRIVPGARALVVGALSYRRADRPPTRSVRVPARVARYAWRDHYRVLRAALERGAEVLRSAGYTARVVADDNALVDREAARRAGLGWYGKSSNLLLPGHGSWFVLGSIVTDAALPPTGVVVEDGCGPCARCIEACPTGAIVAPGVVDARRCLAWLVQAPGDFPREYRNVLGDRLYGCDDCQEVCPPNRVTDRRQPPPAAHPGADDWVDVVDLLDADDGAVMARFGRWYVPRRDPRYLRRNALVVLGNSGAGSEPAVERVLTTYLAHPDPLLRGHAVWAAGQLGRHDLLAEVAAAETDPGVRAELAAASERPGPA